MAIAMTQLDEETTKKVIRQVEYYFSDSNVLKDEFLKKTITESEDGLISLALICSFSRMRMHLGLGGDVKPEDISEETVKAVAETLKNSVSLKFSEDGKKIGRSTELPKPEVVMEQIEARTIAASPLQHNITREELESVFAQCGKVNSINLPRHVGDKRFFCGTALIEFSTEEEAGNALKQDLSYAGVKLELKQKKDFDAEREEKMMELEKSGSSKDYSKNTCNSEMDYPKGLILAFKLKRISEDGSTENNAVCEKAPEGKENGTDDGVGESREKSGEDDSEGGEEMATVGEKYSAAVSTNNQDKVLREDIRSAFNEFGTIKYVDYTMGAESGYIRFEEPQAAEKARAASVVNDGGLFVKNCIASLEAVSGEAEKEYWNLLRGSQEKRRDGKGNRGRGGKSYRGRRWNDSNSGRPNKTQKVAA